MTDWWDVFTYWPVCDDSDFLSVVKDVECLVRALDELFFFLFALAQNTADLSCSCERKINRSFTDYAIFFFS